MPRASARRQAWPAAVGGAAVNDIDASTPHRDLKTVNHFESPARGNDGAGLGYLLKDGHARVRPLVLEIPWPGS